MKVNCDIEYSLYAIMISCSQSLERIKEFKEMKMHNKIECAIADLKKYRHHLYAEYKDELEKLWIFKEFRNRICHWRMVISPDLQSFKFLYFDIVEGEADGFEETHLIENTLNFISEYYKVGVSLSHLIAKLNVSHG